MYRKHSEKSESHYQNRLTDLNDHLFAQIERLGDEDLKGEELKEELERADSMAKIATQIVQNNNTILKTIKLADDMMDVNNSKIALQLVGGVTEK